MTVWQLLAQHVVVSAIALAGGVRLGIYLERRRHPRTHRIIIVKEPDHEPDG